MSNASYAKSDSLVSTEWLAQHLNDSNLRIIESDEDVLLFESGHILGLEIPFAEDEVLAACVETVRRNRLEECYIRPLAFRGDGEMGLKSKNPVRLAIAVWRFRWEGEEGRANDEARGPADRLPSALGFDQAPISLKVISRHFLL